VMFLMTNILNGTLELVFTFFSVSFSVTLAFLLPIIVLSCFAYVVYRIATRKF